MNGGKVIEERSGGAALADPDPLRHKLLGAAPSLLHPAPSKEKSKYVFEDPWLSAPGYPAQDGELDVPSLRASHQPHDRGGPRRPRLGSTGEVAFSTTEASCTGAKPCASSTAASRSLVGVIDTETRLENIKVVEEIGGATGVVATARSTPSAAKPG